MGNKDENKSALKVQKGISHPPSVNPDVIGRIRKNKKKKYSSDEYISGIISGDRIILSQAITLLESSLPEHNDSAQEIIEKCLPYSGGSIRIGITGVPGVGKSTFIETFGRHLTSKGKKLAVLAIDPSSVQTKGSILGDKTRMESLSADPDAFIRPSPASGTPGGVARKTSEIILLCETAGFDTIIVETVGVGQSETTVSSMVDFFLLLMLTGAGDELQGIKRGIMEMADAVVITKADGDNRLIAEGTRVAFQAALRLFPPSLSGWKPKVLTCSSLANTCIDEIWSTILEYVSMTKQSGYFEERRRQQAIARMDDTIIENLKNSFFNSREIKKLRPELELKLYDGTITSYKAALEMLNRYFNK
jgi:LAO/AO transport system kinase